MKILVVHNRYLLRGGEDAVFEEETRLLRDSGCEVRVHVRDNHEIDALGPTPVAISSIWSTATHRQVRQLLGDWRPDVMHVHNSFPLVSPSVYWAAAGVGVPVVKTLHNFRLACLQGTFLRDAAACSDCLGHVPWRGVIRRCYRGSVTHSAVMAAGLVGHRLVGTYRHQIARFIVLDESSIASFVAAGIPRARIVVKPNAVAMPALPAAPAQRRGGLYVGRLSAEKGIAALAQALSLARPPSFTTIGEGPLQHLLDAAGSCQLGQCASDEVYRRMQAAAYLVMPSVGFEQFPRVLVEAFALGLPVIASDRGSLSRLVTPGRTGLLVEPGDPQALAGAVRWAESHPDELRAMGLECQQVYQARFTPEANLRSLLDIYQAVRTPPPPALRAPVQQRRV
jgi:glycosyltransferase involved in cell wall biosynthesis